MCKAENEVEMEKSPDCSHRATSVKHSCDPQVSMHDGEVWDSGIRWLKQSSAPRSHLRMMCLGHKMCYRWPTGDEGRYHLIHQLSTYQRGTALALNSLLSFLPVCLSDGILSFFRKYWMKWPFLFFHAFFSQTSCLPVCPGQWAWPFHLWA